jgi:hypothetical protein
MKLFLFYQKRFFPFLHYLESSDTGMKTALMP